jgi:hypothetical protein
MSTAQKQAQANFKKAIAYRQKHQCSLKEAFAAVKGFDGVTKKGNKTNVHYSKAVAPKKAAKKTVKKDAPKKKVVAKKETKQSRLFGVGSIDNIFMGDFVRVNSKINQIEKNLIKLQNDKLLYAKTSFDKAMYSEQIKDLKSYLSELKKHRTELKKLL